MSISKFSPRRCRRYPAVGVASLRWPLAMGRRALAADERPAPPAQQPSHRWILPSPLPPTGDSRKNNSTRKRKLLAPAAVGLRSARQCALRGAGGGFAPLAAGHAGEESRRRPNSRTPAAVLLPSPSLMEPDQPTSRTARTAAAASVRFPVPRPSEAVNHNRQLSILKSVKGINNHGKNEKLRKGKSKSRNCPLPRLTRFPLAPLRVSALLRYGRNRFAGPGSARCGRVAHPIRRKAQSPGCARAFPRC